ncbi:ATPase, T2SS/T4P/T4SS family [Xanthomonas citri]|uniref:ATPase, T2SS/T4P/T4SS family n=1 Tax=Xanthomonas citri TaxID=346 RepID=UPI000CCE2396|nr:ATPase, T2SS/T4P/T4SS family [Xanthomonas citri]PNV26796.1 twitching motility protein PilT [Xanthomonas citri]
MGERLAQQEFVELILGADFLDMKSHAGTGAARVSVPEDCRDECRELRNSLLRRLESHGDPEFAYIHDEVIYRVTAMVSLGSDEVFFLRRMTAAIRPVERIPFPERFLEFFMNPASKGLFIITGDMASGKTSSAASLLAELLRRHGDTALAIEDPPETLLGGLHGQGRCIQVPVSRRHGTYTQQIEHAMRTGVSTVLIGEVRHEDVANEAIRLAMTVRVLTTIHGKSPVEALQRLADLAGDTADSDKTSKMLGSGLSAVVHQKLERVTAPNGAVLPGVRLGFQSLVVAGPNEAAMRTKIRDGNFESLRQDIDAQQKDKLWKKD